jgi:nucleotide-binding universal stress UspA family protein
MGEVVVGVDGSDAGAAVLAWAVEEAALRGAALRVVNVTQSPAAWVGMGDALGGAVYASISDKDLETICLSTIEEALATVAIPAEVHVIEDPQLGHAGDVLVRASRDAELLVVGSSGHGDIGSVLLGSVGMHCVHHARCPVVVVPTKAPKPVTPSA